MEGEDEPVVMRRPRMSSKDSFGSFEVPSSPRSVLERQPNVAETATLGAPSSSQETHPMNGHQNNGTTKPVTESTVWHVSNPDASHIDHMSANTGCSQIGKSREEILEVNRPTVVLRKKKPPKPLPKQNSTEFNKSPKSPEVTVSSPSSLWYDEPAPNLSPCPETMEPKSNYSEIGNARDETVEVNRPTVVRRTKKPPKPIPVAVFSRPEEEQGDPSELSLMNQSPLSPSEVPKSPDEHIEIRRHTVRPKISPEQKLTTTQGQNEPVNTETSIDTSPDPQFIGDDVHSFVRQFSFSDQSLPVTLPYSRQYKDSAITDLEEFFRNNRGVSGLYSHPMPVTASHSEAIEKVKTYLREMDQT